MPKKWSVIIWSDLVKHAELQGFNWNYAHDMDPLSFPYVATSFSKDKEKYDLNQMGRDIVYHFMQTHSLRKMLVI